MDRRFRYRALLSAAIAGGAVWPMLVGGLQAQSPTPAPSLAVTATPWVQAVPPPTALPAKGANVTVKALSPTATPSVEPSREELARAMAHKREEELARDRAAVAKQPSPPPRNGPQLSSEEREAYARNLDLWQSMPKEEQQTIRSLAAEGMQEEIRKAYESSGLNLDDDQKEVFALRYKQERRRLERDIQQKAKAERTRRMPELMERLKHEFTSASPVAANTPKPTPAASPAISPASPK